MSKEDLISAAVGAALAVAVMLGLGYARLPGAAFHAPPECFYLGDPEAGRDGQSFVLQLFCGAGNESLRLVPFVASAAKKPPVAAAPAPEVKP